MTSKHTEALINMAESQMGYAEQSGGFTKFGEWYQNTHAKEPGFTNAAWCDMFISWAATQTGQAEDVGQFAWTPDHANWYKTQGAWGTKPEPGAVVFFDYDGSNKISAIDHVGLVKSVVNDTTVKTIEGNISNKVVSKTRDDSIIVGYGYPEKVREKNQLKLVKAEEEAAKKAESQPYVQAFAQQSAPVRAASARDDSARNDSARNDSAQEVSAQTTASTQPVQALPEPTQADATAAAASAMLVPAVMVTVMAKRADLKRRFRTLLGKLG